jgi:tetratricopeptide (TPR) repeat protein
MSGPGKAVFLSYTSQDMEAARRICNALRGAGIEVWFDQSELRGGDAWDAAIRKQIKSCALFIPITSANTRARNEGYFRLEWKLAVDRSYLMTAERAFLLPVAIDAAGENDTTVPDRFREVQWTRLPGGEPTTAFIERVAHLLAHDGTPESAAAGMLPATAAVTVKSRMRLVWISAAVLVLLTGAGWITAHRLAAPARIIPYSAEDRRMTFALLPLQAAAEDPIGLQVAKATGDGVFTSLDENHTWVQLTPQAGVTQARTQFSTPRDLARTLNVHFLMRGSVARAPSGDGVTLFVVDGETEHVLGIGTLSIPANALLPRGNDEIDDVTGRLVFYALQAEVARARDKPDAALDVRDLTYRAFVDWGLKRMSDDGKGAYVAGSDLLQRALALAPDDPLALQLTAKINLCDCVDAWSTNVAEQQAIGEAAIDRYLRTHPDDPGMLRQKASLYELRGRFQESLVILDSVLGLDPQNFNAMEDKALVLLRLGRPKEAAIPAIAAYARHPDDRPGRAALVAAIDYELGDYAGAEQMAQKATTEMSKAELSNPNDGTVRLTLIAAAAHLHDDATEKAALADLAASVSGLTSLTAIRKWMYPQANLYGYEPLFEGLRLAGLRD